MITVKTPYQYLSEPDILKDAGIHIEAIGKTALIIGSKTALSVVGEGFFESLKQHGIKYTVQEFIGYPTYATIEKYAVLTEEFDADLIIGIGGGKVLDTAKGVGQKTKKPVVTVPTIAATCAAWASCSIIYDEEGSFAGVISLDYSPQLVLLDLSIIANAPVRYLNAGVADTVAKWYETVPNLKKVKDLNLRLVIKTAELALEVIESKYAKVIKNLEEHTVSEDFKDIVDSVVLLAGLVGSTQADIFYGGFAHPFYNSITKIPETRSRLHGEKVSFGLLAQSVIEEKSTDEIDKLIALLNGLEQPVTLGQLGIEENIVEKVAIIANGIAGNLGYYKALDHELTKSDIERAILRADKIGRKTFEKV